MGTEQTCLMSAEQICTTGYACNKVVRFLPVGSATVAGEQVAPMSNSFYIDKQVLAKLGDPTKIKITVVAM